MSNTLTWKDVELLAQVYHFLANDGEEPVIDFEQLVCSEVEALNNPEKIRKLLRKFEPWGMAVFFNDGKAKMDGRVMELLLALSAKKNQGNPVWLHRLCFGFACIGPGVALEGKSQIQIYPPQLEDFGFKRSNVKSAGDFFVKMLRKGYLSKADNDGNRLKFYFDPFLRLPFWDDILIDEGMFGAILNDLGVKFNRPVRQPESLQPSPPPPLPPLPPPPLFPSEPEEPPNLALDCGDKEMVVKKPRCGWFTRAVTLFKTKNAKVGQLMPVTTGELMQLFGYRNKNSISDFLRQLTTLGLAEVVRERDGSRGGHKIVGIIFKRDPTFTTAVMSVEDARAHFLGENHPRDLGFDDGKKSAAERDAFLTGGLDTANLSLRRVLRQTTAGSKLEAAVIVAMRAVVSAQTALIAEQAAELKKQEHPEQ